MFDSHIHLFENGYRGDRSAGQELREYSEYREQYGISSSLAVGYEGDELHRGNNAYLARLAPTLDWLHPLAYVAVEDGRAALAPLVELPRSLFAGIAMYVLDASSLAGLLSWSPADWAQVPPPGIVSVNTVPALLPLIGEVAAAHPRLTFMISHFGSPRAPGEAEITAAMADILRLALIDNVHVKASGYYALAERGWTRPQQAAATTAIVQAFGTDRVHWGSDFSPCLEATTFAAAVSPPGIEKLAPDERHAMQHESLAGLFRGLRPD